MRDLYIYHPGTGTVIALADPVYLVDGDIAGESVMEDMSMGANVSEREHKGYRVDNYNMTNLFFGD